MELALRILGYNVAALVLMLLTGLIWSWIAFFGSLFVALVG